MSDHISFQSNIHVPFIPDEIYIMTHKDVAFCTLELCIRPFAGIASSDVTIFLPVAMEKRLYRAAQAFNAAMNTDTMSATS